MKFVKEITPKGLLLPVTAARLAGFEANERAEYHVLKGAMVVLKGRMTAPELLEVVQQFTSFSATLLHHLSQVCGPCEDCADGCLCGDTEDSPLAHLPPELLLSFAETGTCLGELEDHLIAEDIIYGG